MQFNWVRQRCVLQTIFVLSRPCCALRFISGVCLTRTFRNQINTYIIHIQTYQIRVKEAYMVKRSHDPITKSIDCIFFRTANQSI